MTNKRIEELQYLAESLQLHSSYVELTTLSSSEKSFLQRHLANLVVCLETMQKSQVQ